MKTGWPKRQPRAGCLRVQEGQERGHLRDDRGGRQAVADRDLDVGSGRAETLDLGLARLVERSTQVGSEQEFLFRSGVRADLEKAPPRHEFRTQARG